MCTFLPDSEIRPILRPHYAADPLWSNPARPCQSRSFVASYRMTCLWDLGVMYGRSWEVTLCPNYRSDFGLIFLQSTLIGFTIQMVCNLYFNSRFFQISYALSWITMQDVTSILFDTKAREHNTNTMTGLDLWLKGHLTVANHSKSFLQKCHFLKFLSSLSHPPIVSFTVHVLAVVKESLYPQLKFWWKHLQ